MEGFQEEETQNSEESHWADYLNNEEGGDAGSEHSRQRKAMLRVGNWKWRTVFEELQDFPDAWHSPHVGIVWEVKLDPEGDYTS